MRGSIAIFKYTMVEKRIAPLISGKFEPKLKAESLSVNELWLVDTYAVKTHEN